MAVRTLLPALSRLRSEVTDNGPGFDPEVVRRDSINAGSGGWGLWLVERLTDRWGVLVRGRSRVPAKVDRR